MLSSDIPSLEDKSLASSIIEFMPLVIDINSSFILSIFLAIQSLSFSSILAWSLCMREHKLFLRLVASQSKKMSRYLLFNSVVILAICSTCNLYLCAFSIKESVL